MASRWKIPFLFAAVAGAACTPSFQDASEVTDLRVLAVQAEPPEAQFDAQGTQDVQVRVLAVDPSLRGLPSATISMSASICLPTDSRRCEGGGPRFDFPAQTRPEGAGLSLTVPGGLMAPVIEIYKGSDDLRGLGGIRVMFALSVEDGDPHGPVAADKILLYSEAGKPPNHNPLLTGVALTIAGVPQDPPAPGQPLTLKRGVEYGLRPLLADGAREEYDATDLRGNTVHLVEQPRYFFFATQGAELDRATADEPLDGVAPSDGLTRIQALSTGPPAGTLWVVVRDGRGGESWLELPWVKG